MRDADASMSIASIKGMERTKMVYQRDKTAQRKGVEKSTLKGGITCFSWYLEGNLEKLLAIFGPSLLRTNRPTASEMSIASAAILVFDDCALTEEHIAAFVT